jgi:alpha-1,3-mannosyltransferase
LAKRALFDPKYFWLVASLCLLADAVLTTAIIRYIAFTEIDFQTYVQQAQLFLKGERQYDKITGDAGPCVYPALHLYLSSALVYVSKAGANLLPAQAVYAALYIVHQLIVMAIYREAGMPAAVLPALVVSKRLHSIYVLRLFNDCWAATLMSACTLALCKRRYGLASTLFSLALGIKMNILLYAPAMAAVYLRSIGLRQSFFEGVKVILIQALIGSPFLQFDARAYIRSAFDLSRAFLYTWTVNWRFLHETVFLDRRFANTLLTLHVAAIVLFLTYRWAPSRGVRHYLTLDQADVPTARSTVVILFTSNLLGITLARSLHYQFYSWYAQQLPLLVYVANIPYASKIPVLFAIEDAWNTFPSTKTSSAFLFVAHIYLLIGLWRAK